MPQSQTAPFGSWSSPITADLVARGAIRLGQIALDGGDVYWIERRPAERGRNVIVRRTADGRLHDITPPGFDARSRVHEYGGGEMAVAGGVVYFSNLADQRLYRQVGGALPEPVTPPGSWRYADGVVDPQRGRLICVREEQALPSPINTLVSIDLRQGGAGEVIAQGNDFYSSPRLSPGGSHLAWLTWNHPHMPWDGCELWLAAVRPDGSLADPRRLAGGAGESIFQPEWSPEGTLYFASDRTGWWNLYRWQEGQAVPVCPLAAEFGAPQWSLGMSLYAFSAPDRIVCAYAQRGTWHLGEIDTLSGELRPLEVPYTEIREVRCAEGQALLRAGSPTQAPAIVAVDLASGETSLLRSSGNAVDPAYISLPESIEFPTEHGRTAHAFHYPPRNPEYAAPQGELPPLLVMSHGGPTGAASTALDLKTQFWTSRGFSVLDVNYGGSTGYGRAYRRRLEGGWGVVDVDDCAHGARYLVARGVVDGNRLAITGSSAGGYTTLCALTFRSLFRAGASYYGIGDLEAMAQDTHKFEAHYLDTLVGPYPERQDLYRARSPIHHTECLSCPVIFFQGLEDRIVLPSQAEAMVQALRQKGLPVAYLAFAGEQHGFRRRETIRRALEAELCFYAQVFGFALAEPVEPIAIENLHPD